MASFQSHFSIVSSDAYAYVTSIMSVHQMIEECSFIERISFVDKDYSVPYSSMFSSFLSFFPPMVLSVFFILFSCCILYIISKNFNET